MTVLIIDENTDNAMYYARQLVGPYNVCICSNRASATQMLLDLRPDALIIDLIILFKLKPLPFHPKVIIGVTYFFSNTVIQEASAEGVHELVRLPCASDCMSRKINARLYQSIL